MGRAVYPHELVDPDFSWLITRYQENHPGSINVEATGIPIVFIKSEPENLQPKPILPLPYPKQSPRSVGEGNK